MSLSLIKDKILEAVKKDNREKRTQLHSVFLHWLTITGNSQVDPVAVIDEAGATIQKEGLSTREDLMQLVTLSKQKCQQSGVKWMLNVLYFARTIMTIKEKKSFFEYLYEECEGFWILVSCLFQEGRVFILEHELSGLEQAYSYLHNLVNDENSGLLDHEIICEVHERVMQETPRQGYSKCQRVVEYKGQVHFYCLPEIINVEMTMLLDEFNSKWWKIKTKTRNVHSLASLISSFLVRFLRIHPFGDGNGRTARLIAVYILESFGISRPLLILNEDYESWCNIFIYN